MSWVKELPVSTKVAIAVAAAVVYAVARDVQDHGVPATWAQAAEMLARAVIAGGSVGGLGWLVPERNPAPSALASVERRGLR